jgi:hypothetical protein
MIPTRTPSLSSVAARPAEEPPDLPPEALGTHGPEGVGRCPQCERLATFIYLDEARGQARGVCSTCGADWWVA